MNIDGEVKLIVAQAFGIEDRQLSPETHLVKDLCHSLDFAPAARILTQMFKACEQKFHIRIPDAEAENLVTVGKLSLYIKEQSLQHESVWPPSPNRPSV